MASTTVLVGGFSNTIEIFDLAINEDDIKESSLSHRESVRCDENPSFLHINQSNVYAVNEVSNYKGESSGGVSYFKLKDKTLVYIFSTFSSGQDPCHINVHPIRNCAYISNYSSGHFSVLKLKDGRPTGGIYIESFDEGSGVNPERQEASHLHGTFYFKNFVYVVDLGADKIWHYTHDDKDFTAGNPAFTKTPPGSGPRHMTFLEKEKLAFVITELSNELIVYRVNENNGSLDKMSSYEFLKPDLQGENYGAGIHIHPNGRFVYLSNRINGSIIVYEIVNTQNGTLKRIQRFETEGTWPRDFDIHCSGKILLVADQFKDIVEMIAIDESNGMLEHLQSVSCKNKPSSVVFSD